MSYFSNLKYRYSGFSIVEKIIFLNIIFFITPYFINTLLFLFDVNSKSYLDLFLLSPELNNFILKPWTIITYGFIHDGFFHLFWNMLLLYYSGRMILNLFPSSIFINVYFLGIIVGGILFLFSYSFFPVFKGDFSSMGGSSAGAMATIIFICTYSLDNEIRLFFFNLKLKYIGVLFFVFDVIQIPYGNSGGHIAHIGGAILGFLYARNLIKGRDIGFSFEKIWKFFLQRNKSNLRKESFQDKTLKSKKFVNYEKQKKVDEILDKINKSGYESLSDEEKDFLIHYGKD
ncbi:MAG: rhomboid family intramembrane serine protease [Bacteroidota bacterium]|nr:rhomboid family intramembrane serine protease [Bacteroidota bacterium]